jgi:hypothetical protein
LREEKVKIRLDGDQGILRNLRKVLRRVIANRDLKMPVPSIEPLLESGPASPFSRVVRAAAERVEGKLAKIVWLSA